MLYSMKMRAAKGGDHKAGGMHISGAERILSEAELLNSAQAMILRALKHGRGKADFINLKIETVQTADIKAAPLLPIISHQADSVAEGRAIAAKLLQQSGVSAGAVQSGLAMLTGLTDSMRGAMLLDAASGTRLDDLATRGVRVSNMDIADEKNFLAWLKQQNYTDVHVREAVVLAAKVAYHPAVVAELCWSDDPNYVVGYVADKNAYQRIAPLKESGSWQGGRIFFIKPATDLTELITYLQHQTVLVRGGAF